MINSRLNPTLPSSDPHTIFGSDMGQKKLRYGS